ncbi:hypothetical protein ACC706_37840, partial [Rhizobium johnstonii]
MEGAEHQNNPFWTPALHTATWGTQDAAGLAVEHLNKIGNTGGRIGIEPAFLPSGVLTALNRYNICVASTNRAPCSREASRS